MLSFPGIWSLLRSFLSLFWPKYSAFYLIRCCPWMRWSCLMIGAVACSYNAFLCYHQLLNKDYPPIFASIFLIVSHPAISRRMTQERLCAVVCELTKSTLVSLRLVLPCLDSCSRLGFLPAPPVSSSNTKAFPHLIPSGSHRLTYCSA